MTKNPILNALAAAAYIGIITLVLYFGTLVKLGQNSLYAPIVMISLFTLSAAVMGYLFCFQPIQLYFDGKKKAAVNLFLQTLAAFAAITFLLLVLLFTRVIH